MTSYSDYFHIDATLSTPEGLSDLDFATELVRRLNTLLENPAFPEVRRLLTTLLFTGTPVAQRFADEHPTLQTTDDNLLHPMGVLNGLIGTYRYEMGGVSLTGIPYVAGVFDVNGRLERVELTTT